ncbi:MAG: hypothetical protein Q8M01_02415 [Rubrivivax sp.]|nr:hypothetical protein [Rubrivivax sp.]
MFDVANLVADAMCNIEHSHDPFLGGGGPKFNASFILGGQIAGEDTRLSRIYVEGNFIGAGTDTNLLQSGEATYGKPILDLAVTRARPWTTRPSVCWSRSIRRCSATFPLACRSTFCATRETA